MLGILGLLGAAVAPPATAQVADKTTIIVEGARIEKLRAETYQFVNALGAFSGDQPTARWLKDVCPKALGVEPDIASVVERQITQIASNAGARVAGKGCAPNFVIAFTTDASSFTQQVLKRDPSAANEVKSAAQRALKSEGLPIRWWYNTAVATRDGRPVLASAPAINNLPANDEASVLTQYESGRISNGVTRGIESVSIVVDLNLVEGKRLASLIDYAALVGLSELRVGSSTSGSVLSLFDPASNVRGLTPADKAFLHTLYEMPLDRTAKKQRQALVDGMVRSRLVP